MTASSIPGIKSREAQTGISSPGLLRNKAGAPENRFREPRLPALLHAPDALDSEDVPVANDVDREIWGYLSAFDGITAQTQALRHVAEAFQSQPSTSALRRVICNLLAQHRKRLADGTESVLIANT